MYTIIYLQHFKKALKRLSKKDPTLPRKVESALRSFHPKIAISIGRKIFKLRLPGLNRGKSAGYRLYVYLLEVRHAISPIFIHAKNEQENLSWEELTNHVMIIENELYQALG